MLMQKELFQEGDAERLMAALSTPNLYVRRAQFSSIFMALTGTCTGAAPCQPLNSTSEAGHL